MINWEVVETSVAG